MGACDGLCVVQLPTPVVYHRPIEYFSMLSRVESVGEVPTLMLWPHCMTIVALLPPILVAI